MNYFRFGTCANHYIRYCIFLSFFISIMSCSSISIYLFTRSLDCFTDLILPISETDVLTFGEHFVLIAWIKWSTFTILKLPLDNWVLCYLLSSSPSLKLPINVWLHHRVLWDYRATLSIGCTKLHSEYCGILRDATELLYRTQLNVQRYMRTGNSWNIFVMLHELHFQIIAFRKTIISGSLFMYLHTSSYYIKNNKKKY